MIFADVVSGLEASGFTEALRRSRWVYPLVNAAHILGVATLVGAAIPMDLRLAGFWRGSMPLMDVIRLLRPVAATGFVIAALSGGMLFAVQAVDYAAMPLFWVKLGLIALALANALLLGRRVQDLSPNARRWVGIASLTLWVSVLVCGRMLGYV